MSSGRTTSSRCASVTHEQPLYEGRCRLVRPQLRRLLVYVDGPFPGFEAEQVRAFQDSPTEWIEAYVLDNASALRAVFAAWPPDVVLANHAMMAPYLVKQALAAAAPYVVTVHGSELNFSVKHDPRLVPFALEGLEAAAAVVTVSEPGAAEIITWAAEHGVRYGEQDLCDPAGGRCAYLRPCLRSSGGDRGSKP